MNIHTVLTNLDRTIANKQALLDSCQEKARQKLGNIDAYVTGATIGFLEINLEELRNIRKDVLQCCEQDVEKSWRENPDRSGGQFTQDEIYNPERTNWIEP